MHDAAPDGPPEPITRERAKQFIDEAPAGTLLVVEPEAVPVLGDVPPGEVPMDVSVNAYRFGDVSTLAMDVSGGPDGRGV